MIRILLDKAFDTERHYIHAVGLSTDTKPTAGIITGSRFVAVDTGAGYLFDETSGEWNENQQIPEQLIHMGTETDYPLSAAHTEYPMGITLIYTLASTSYPYGTGTVVTIRSANARGVQLAFGNSSNSYKLRTADYNGWSDWHTMGDFVVTVSGTTPTINAQAGARYVCGKVATISIAPPASGCIDVVFQSGSTPTVLTITPPTGVTVKWANGFDPTALEANTTYEINIMDGLGVAVSWT